MSVSSTSSRKRKSSSYGTGSVYNDDIGDDSGSTRTLPDKKQNHSEIEKRRRDKMNTYISELSSMVPMCGTMARKLDKLTVLRMAVQHLRSVRGALSSCPLTARPRPAFLSEKELNTLILQAGHDCFLLVVGCDRGRLMYVSASVNKVLVYDQSELIGQSLFDILHPKDVAKVKEQLSSSDLSPRERFIDAKTMLPLKSDVVAGASRFSPGARRSFFCRIKCKALPDDTAASVMSMKEDPEPTSKLRKKHSEKKYCVVQCTGYLKSWAPAELSEASSTTADCTEDGEASNMSCLVAVGRTLEDLTPMSVTTCPTVPTRPLMYTSRHATDGKFIFVDQRVTLALGFLPQELLGTSLYEYMSGPEIAEVAGTHKAALLNRNTLQTPAYSFRKKDGTFASIRTHFKPFRNPWTKDVECLVANNTVLSDNHMPIHQSAEQSTFEIYKEKPDTEMQRLIDSRVESHQIGSTIAEEVLRRSPTEYIPELPPDLLQDAVFNQQTSLVDNILGLEVPEYLHVRNNVPLSVAGVRDSPPQSENGIELPVGSPLPVSPPLPSLGIDGNGEAAMAVIMSLLEADAGLGGQVNFSGLPWPLP
uniref:BMAL n=1 Tax=Antheraea pernyi TaxID=7119 RepID=Q6VRU5_ANTPE|nr:BMAL [Antheraea pernyi]